MKLIDAMIRQGNAIFRWRSYLPLAIFPVAALILVESAAILPRRAMPSSEWWAMLCMALSFAGLGLRVATVGFVPSLTSGRNTREHHADVLNTTGLYSVTRHPLYLANFIVFLGFCLVLRSAAFVAFGVLAFILYYERIILAEEKFLGSVFGDEFNKWAERTPVVIPKARLWQPPALPFSARTALLREYHGVLLVPAVFFALRMIEGVLLDGKSAKAVLDASASHLIVLAAAAAFYVVAYVLRKHTSLLAAFGRGP